MQLLTFTIASEVYAIPSKRVIEVLPLVAARPIPRMPDYIPGLFTYRGRLVPLVDLGLRIAGTVLQRRLSTRVIVAELPSDRGAMAAGRGQSLVHLGLVAENVVSIRAVDDEEMASKEMALPSAPYLGRIYRIHRSGGHFQAGRDHMTVQMIELEHLLPHELLHGLFPEGDAATARMAGDHAAE